ncbi:unnamed protein product [Cochlearia groenlandica]
MDKHLIRTKQPKTKPIAVASSSSDEEVSSVEWEEVKMSREEEELIKRMHKLVGGRWELIAGRIPGRSPLQIERFWIFTNTRC